MKRRWMRRIAVILVLCLVFSDNLTGVFMRTQAVESDSSVASFGVSGNDAVSSGDVISGEETEEPTEETEQSSEEATEETTEETTVEETEAEDATEETLVEETEALEESEAADALKEMLKEFLQNPAAQVEDIPVIMAENQYTMPADLATYQAAREAGRTEFYIATETDYLNAQTLSTYAEVNGFDDITITILEPSNADRTWDISNISGFTGIGTAEYPFKGTIRCYYANGDGVRFSMDKPLLAYMGDGAVFQQFDMTCNGSCAAIAQNISGTVTISDVWLRGSIGNGSGTVGIIASEIASDSVVNISGVKIAEGILPVTGAYAGSIAGIAGNNVTISLGDNVALGTSTENTVTGTEAAGAYFGMVKGDYTWNLADEDKIKARVLGGGANCYTGQFAGQLLSDTNSGTGTLTITGGNSVTAKVSGAGSGGGLVGLCGEGANIAIPEGTFTISGGIDGNTGSSGGVVGVLVNPYMEFANYTITAKVSGKYAGGIVGEIQGGKCIIRDVNVAEVSGTSATGGILGNVVNAAAVELQGAITLTSVLPHGNGTNGLVVGLQDRSLIYLSEVEGKIGGTTYQVSPVTTHREDIGKYGGLYRNQSVSGGKLIGDGTLANVGVINNTVAKDGDWYQMTSVSDFESLAIVLGTDGNFGTNVFGGASYTDLLKAAYTVTSSVDISYDKTGIIALNRNDQVDNSGYEFRGKMQGVNSTITITQNSTVKQRAMGLFSAVTGHPEFSNLIIEGTVENANGVGGLAYQHNGSGTNHGLTLNKITMRKNLQNCSGWVGGVLARKTSGGSYELNATDITLASNISTGGAEKYSGFITYMTNANVTISNVILAGSLSSTTSSTEVGGFLGQKWTSIGGTIENVTVQSGTTYNSNGGFGVLWNTMTNDSNNGEHVTLDKVKLDGLTVNASASIANCSLLIRDAKNLVADIVDYDSTGCVVNNPGANFDEIAGMTRSNPNRTVELPLAANTGIISLHSSDAYFPTYHYQNKVESLKNMTNSATMYYYDVFQYLENADGTVKTENQIAENILDKPEKVLLWNVLQMSPESVRNTFRKYFTNNYYQPVNNQTYYFKGTLDLSGISYYPTPNVVNGTYIGQDNATITFGAKTDTVDMGEWTLGNERVGCQHFGLQGGLLYNDFGNMYLNVRDITFAGTLANLDLRSGALVAGEVGVADGGSFKNITLDNLWVADYNGTAENVGLLISKLPANTVTLDGIKMTGYAADNGGKKAAAALIGYAGGQDVTNMVLNFSNMVIADEKDGDNHNGDVLAYASFIFEYNYTDNTEINTGSGIYLFSEEDAKTGNVTYGSELDESTEFSDNSKTVLSTMGISNTDYIPYIYKYETIQVNPKAGDILKGCGTYDDPYVIENEKQFLTLYRYLNERELNEYYPTYQYDSFYQQGGGWKITQLGDDTTFCETKHEAVWNAETGSYDGDIVAYGGEDFPTPEELSHAYYMLAADIDLSSLENETYKQIADDFVGFGTDFRPFAGVWYGAGHSVTMPTKDNAYNNYGFIQYAQGAVVKELTIKTVQATDVNQSVVVALQQVGGGVIGTILGGDNIIDKVTVQVDLWPGGNLVCAGGYVGLVKKGGLILRNVPGDGLANLRFKGTTEGYSFLGAVAGKVEDGYVLYEGTDGGSSYLWRGNGGNTAYPAIPNYDILNGTQLKTGGITVNRTESTDASGIINVDVTVNISDAAGLQIMAMALNADALNVKPSDFTDYTECGYTENSRSRKAKYDSIGQVTQDCLDAAMYDNVMGYSEAANKAYAYPYLYDYMGITDDAYLNYWVESDGDGYSVLNPSMPLGTERGTECYRTTWELAGGTYDMSQAQFGCSFRGIGASYQLGNAHGGTFHGNFYGNNSKIVLELERKILSGEVGSNDSLCRVGLFNTIYGSYKALYDTPVDFAVPTALSEATSGVEEFDITKTYLKGDRVLYNGSVYELTIADSFSGYAPVDPWNYWQLVTESGEELVNCFEIKDFVLAGSIDGHGDGTTLLAGGVAACIEAGNYVISNVSVDSENPLTIGTTNGKVNHMGGMIGWIGGNSYIMVQDCKYVGTSNKPIVLKGTSNSGGVTGNNYGTLKVQNVQMDYLQISSSSGTVGGLVGYTKYGDTICVGTLSSPVSLSNSTVAGKVTGGFVGKSEAPVYVQYGACKNSKVGISSSVESTGGIVGFAAASVAISDVECANLTMNSYSNIGGIVGKTVGSTGVSSIQNITMTNSVLEELSNYDGHAEGIGGIVGKNEQTLTIQNVKLTGTQTDGVYNFRIRGSKQVRTAVQGVGGVVGYHITETNVLTLKDCVVNTVDISTDINITGSYSAQAIGAGGIVGFVAGEVILVPGGAITTENLSVKVPLVSEQVAGTVMGSGGCFGIVWFKYNLYYANIWGGDSFTYHEGMSAKGNTVTGKYAGGLIGYNDLAQFRLSGVNVANGTVTSDEMAGGLVGYMLSNYSGSAFNPNGTDPATEPVNLVTGMTISGKMAGGGFGYLKLHAPLRAERIEIRSNVIQSTVDMEERIVGGLIGACEATSTHSGSFYDISIKDNTIVAEVAGTTLDVETEQDQLAVGGLIGKTLANNSGSIGNINLDGVFVENTNRIGVRQSGTDEVKLIKANGTTYQLSDLVLPTVGESIATDVEAIESLEQEFGYFVGSFVGVWEATNVQMYVLDEQEENGKFVPPVMTTNPPVVDVGRNTSQGIDDYRSNCHIIYGAEVAVAADVEKNLADMKAEVEKITSEYTGQETYAELLTELRVPASTLDLFNLSYVDSYQFPGTELKIEFPMLVYRVENGTLQDVMESVTDVMTNMAGLSASDMKTLTIKCTPKLYDGSTFTTGTTASISATVNDGVATYTMEEHDGVTDDKLSYTEITFTYQTKSDNSGQHKKVFVLPVFVEEPILYSVHSKIMEGKVSDVSTIRANGTSEENNNIIMANDSDYTLLLEYTYGEAREQMVDGVTVEKVFYLEQNSELKSLPVGTQLLLIDVTGGNKAYYYTVTEDVADGEVVPIKFTDFKDSSGVNSYVNPSINNLPDVTDEGQEYYTDLGGHFLTETAVERYLLTVFSNDSDTKSKVYSIHAGIQIDDENLKSRFQLEKDHAEETVWNITANPGLEVSLINKGTDTDISGIISKSDELTVKAAFALTAQDVYWAQKSRQDVTVIDSSNTAKYLEVAFYLRDNSGNRVALPDGTNFSYKLADGGYSGNRVIPDDSIIYYYKDIRNQFGIEDSEYQINDISENTTVALEYRLDFSGADLSTILDDSYVAWIELLRTANRDYPMGNGSEVDSYSETVNANAMQELGFALRADALEDLAINTYPAPAAENTIPGHIMFDFSENLKLAGAGVGKDLVLEKWASLDYEVTYQLYKKTENGYVAYTGEDITISVTDPDTGLEEVGEEGSLTVTYNFTADQIEAGNGESPVDGVLSFPCLVTQYTDRLVAETDSLTNYRLEATLTIKEKGITSTDAERTTDFFVYTVTKLKFDL